MWLLERETKRAIESAVQAGFSPSAAQLAQYSVSAAEGGSPVGGVARIDVTGVLTKNQNIMAALFGGGNTTYTSIISALQKADSDPGVSSISMFIDSPGGNVDGLFETIDAMKAVSKPINVEAARAASAAYAIAAQGSTIAAASPSAQFGSIGVVQGFYVDDSVVEITSTNAPKKRPDVTTEEGVAVIRESLDELHDLFVDAIATGRGTDSKNINANYGEGATLLASAALKRGMIDSIGASNTKPTTANSGKQQEKRSMDLTTLKAQHPDVYAAAAKEATAAERDRVGAFLVAGETSGDMKTAISAIKEGTEMTLTLSTTFMMAAANKSDIKNRQADDLEAGAADNANLSDTTDGSEAAAKAVLAATAEMCGVEL